MPTLIYPFDIKKYFHEGYNTVKAGPSGRSGNVIIIRLVNLFMQELHLAYAASSPMAFNGITEALNSFCNTWIEVALRANGPRGEFSLRELRLIKMDQEEIDQISLELRKKDAESELGSRARLLGPFGRPLGNR